jgi:hypothetical protein
MKSRRLLKCSPPVKSSQYRITDTFHECHSHGSIAPRAFARDPVRPRRPLSPGFVPLQMSPDVLACVSWTVHGTMYSKSGIPSGRNSDRHILSLHTLELDGRCSMRSPSYSNSICDRFDPYLNSIYLYRILYLICRY